MYEFILFDLDGTLLDTLDDLVNSVNFALETVGLPKRAKKEIRSFIGNGIRLLIQRAIGPQNESVFENAFIAFKTHYAAHCADNTKPYDGVLEMLKTLKEQGKRLAVLSNKAHFATVELCKKYFGDLIEFVMGERESEGIAKKPAPDSVFAALQAMGGERARAVYIGDSEVDIQTAQNAKLDCISVTWGWKDKDFLIKNGAKRFADTPQQLSAFLQANK